MKKIYLSLILLLISIQPVFASTNTYQRTEDNLRIPSSVEVTDLNKNNILLTPSVDANEKVYDFADLLTDDEENLIYNKIIEYINTYNMDLVIVTTNHIDTIDTRHYGMDFYDYNDFGTDNKKSGILLIIDMENRRYEMITTGEAIIMYDDDRVNNILDYIFNDIKNQTYYSGINNFISQSSYYASLGVPDSNKYASVDEKGNITINKPIPWGVMIIISLVVTFIIILILVKKNKMVKKATTAKEYLDNGSLVINVLSDTLIDTHVSKVKIDHSSSSGSGSSTSHGSSGSSHGGGGRSF